jgi:hypothetical protein
VAAIATSMRRKSESLLSPSAHSHLAGSGLSIGAATPVVPGGSHD